MSYQPLTGFATPEGTNTFVENALKKSVVPEHFRQVYDDLMLSSLGMGSYLGNPDSTTDQHMAAAAYMSLKTGAVNVLDTAINYRAQCSERSLGLALNKLVNERELTRQEVFVCSKNGFLTPDGQIAEDFRSYVMRELVDPGVITPNDIVGGMHCMTPAYLEDQLHRSLANLGLGTLDLMYLHNAAESQLPQIGVEAFMDALRDAFGFYEEAIRAGLIRYYGMATWNCFTVGAEDPGFLNLEDVVLLAESVGGTAHGFRYIQLPFNLGLTDALNEENQRVKGEQMSLLHAAQELGMGVFTSVPLMQGQLLDQTVPLFDGLKTPSQCCLQFVRSTPGIIAPLVGHKVPVHVEDNLGIAKVPPLSLEAFDARFRMKEEPA